MHDFATVGWQRDLGLENGHLWWSVRRISAEPDSHKGWDFAHRFSEQIARFLHKNERMSDLLKKTSNSLIFG